MLFTPLAFCGQTEIQRIQDIHVSLSVSDGFSRAIAPTLKTPHSLFANCTAVLWIIARKYLMAFTPPTALTDIAALLKDEGFAALRAVHSLCLRFGHSFGFWGLLV